MKTIAVTVTTLAVLAALIGWAAGGITMIEAIALVALGVLISLTVGRLREKEAMLPPDDEGQRHHRGRGGGGLM